MKKTKTTYSQDQIAVAFDLYNMLRSFGDSRWKSFKRAIRALRRHPDTPDRPFFSWDLRRQKKTVAVKPKQVFLLAAITEDQFNEGRQALNAVMAKRNMRNPREMEWSELKQLSDVALLVACCDDWGGEQWKALEAVNTPLFQEFNHQQHDITLSHLGKTRICANAMAIRNPAATTVECHSPFEANCQFWTLRAKRSLSFTKPFSRMQWSKELEERLGG